MKHFKTYDQFMSIFERRSVGGVQIDQKLMQAAGVIASYINKKTKKDYKQFPFPMYHNGEMGIMYFSDKDNSAFRVGGVGDGPGIVGSLDYFSDYAKQVADYSFSSDNFSIIQLVAELTRVIQDPKYISQVNEAIEFIGESKRSLTPQEAQMVAKQLADGKAATEISKELGVPYSQILRIKRDVPMRESDSPTVIQNEQTLGDKVLFFEETMGDIYDISRKVAAGAFNSLFISGRAGTGKTFNVEKAMNDEGLIEGEDWVKVSGATSVIMMFKTMYQYRNNVIVFDDADAVFRDENGRNILKAALDTKKVRNISYLKKLEMLFDPKDFDNDPQGMYNAIESGKIPNKFDFSGRVIFISNLPKDKADPDGAIRSRSILIDVNPDDATLMERMRIILPHLEPRDMPISEKEEIYEFMKKAKDVSMRTFVKAAGFKQAGLKNWERMAQRYL